MKTVKSGEVVVSATRSEQELENVAIPVAVITKQQIERQGAMRLNEALEEQTGLAIMHDHGTGVQMQGFDPAYTLILIDGEPVVGRTAGTLELTRFTVANIERVEIVKGPSSSLFGSEALGGVINIITKQAEEPLKLRLNTRYGSFNTTDINTILEGTVGNFSASLILNRNNSNGYDLTPETQSRTTPEFFFVQGITRRHIVAAKSLDLVAINCNDLFFCQIYHFRLRLSRLLCSGLMFR